MHLEMPLFQVMAKIDFFSFAKWLENWRFSAGSTFCLSKQTSSTLIYTLHSQSQLINDLLEEGYSYVRVGRMQSDPLERRFSQYRQMNGGDFLVSLNKVTYSKKILLCHSLVKEDIDFWNESALVTNPSLNFEKLEQLLEDNFVATEETTLTNESEEVSFFIAGYVAKQLHTKTHCDVCASRFSGCAADVATGSYFDILTRGGLTIPSLELSQYVSQCFAVLNYTDKRVLQQCPNLPSRAAGQFILHYHCENVLFTCDYHTAWGGQIAQKIIVNIYFNNKQKITNNFIRKNAVVAFKQRQRTKH